MTGGRQRGTQIQWYCPQWRGCLGRRMDTLTLGKRFQRLNKHFNRVELALGGFGLVTSEGLSNCPCFQVVFKKINLIVMSLSPSLTARLFVHSYVPHRVRHTTFFMLNILLNCTRLTRTLVKFGRSGRKLKNYL